MLCEDMKLFAVYMHARWKKPKNGYFKCNVDANFFDNQNQTRVGMCIWDEQGNFVAARTAWREPCFTIQEGETWGLLLVL